MVDWERKYHEDMEVLAKRVRQFRAEQTSIIHAKDEMIHALESKIATRDLKIRELEERVIALEPNRKYKEAIQRRRRYSEEEKRYMRQLYKKCGYSRMETWRQLQLENLNISYKHLGVILREKDNGRKR